MSQEPPPTPFVDSVLFPTDFSAESEDAFAHALAIGVLRKARLTLLHVGSGEAAQDDWRKFPSVRRTLMRWGVLEEGSSRKDVVEKLRVGVTKVGMRGVSPVRATLDFLDSLVTFQTEEHVSFLNLLAIFLEPIHESPFVHGPTEPGDDNFFGHGVRSWPTIPASTGESPCAGPVQSERGPLQAWGCTA